MYSKGTTRVLNTIGIILILLGVMLWYMHQNIDFKQITAPFESMTSSATETITGKTEEEQEKEKAEKAEEKEEKKEERQETVQDIKDKTGLTKAQNYYIKFMTFVKKMEKMILDLPYKPLIALALLALFFVKSFVSIVPVTFTYMLTALVFPMWLAVIINIGGVSILFAVKYWKGRRKESNSLRKLIAKIEPLEKIIADSDKGDGSGNTKLLVGARLIPSVPVNPVSQLYGHMQYPFRKFLILSNVGYLYKIIAFTAVGSNIDDPFSAAFIGPIIFMLIFTGVGIIIFNAIMSYAKKHAPVDPLPKPTDKGFNAPYGAAPSVSAPNLGANDAVKAPSFTGTTSVQTTTIPRDNALTSQTRIAQKNRDRSTDVTGK